ncbi:MAG: MoxR family ATPase [Geminicoccaceae bacterium]
MSSLSEIGNPGRPAQEIDAIHGHVTAIRNRLDAGVVGQQTVTRRLLVALLADGHVLLEGAPGLAKTRLARLLAEQFEGRFGRIQFTPDLLPSDLTGSAIYDPEARSFFFQEGPLFTCFLLADEINRAPAKVQSALLEAMEERQVTAGGSTRPLPDPFFVIATQNPIEHDGTWELPQAQLDRFLLHLRIDYPDPAAEMNILDLALDEARAGERERFAPLPASDLAAAQRAVLDVHVSPLIKDHVVRLVSATRGYPQVIEGIGEHLEHPISPRGSIALVRAAQAAAWLDGRDHVLPEDIADLAPGVLRHRLGLTYRAEAEGITADRLIDRLLEKVDGV